MTLPEAPSLILDFDSTLIVEESLDEFARIVLEDHENRDEICERLQQITNLGMTGKMPFDQSLTERLALFNAHQRHIDQLNERLAGKISPSALRQADWFAENAGNIYVVSGGFEEFIKPTVAQLGLLASNVYANGFLLDANGNIVGHDTSRHAARAGGKITQVRELDLCGPVIGIGDGYTDAEIKLSGEADEFWAYTETAQRPNVIARADRVVQSFDEIIDLVSAKTLNVV